MQLPGLVANTLIGAVVDMKDRTVERSCSECGEIFMTSVRPGRPIAYCSQPCRISGTNRRSAARKRKSPEQRTCTVCDSTFVTSHASKKTCSAECSAENSRRIHREHAARKYKPAPVRPMRPCVVCGVTFRPKRPRSRCCGDLCRRRMYDQERTKAKQSQPRTCRKCGVNEVDRKPGIPVCDACKVDGRDPVKAAAKERRRRFRTYGITEDDYNRMLAAQGHRCGICRTDTPGAKGWAIDHCHESDMVRGILCSACNSAIGLLKENPAVIERAAEYVRQHTQIRLVV